MLDPALVREDLMNSEEARRFVASGVESGLMMLVTVQNAVSGIQPKSLDGSDETLATYLHALNEEVHEFGRELRWKPWSSDKEVDEQAAVKEFSDVLAFLGVVIINAAKRLGVDPYDLCQTFGREYARTSRDNVRRLTEHVAAGAGGE